MYAGATTYKFEDRGLSRVEIAVGARLRRTETFHLNWSVLSDEITAEELPALIARDGAIPIPHGTTIDPILRRSPLRAARSGMGAANCSPLEKYGYEDR